jgi:ferredoxin-type protein NapH
VKLIHGRRISQAAGVVLGLFGATGIGMTHILFPGLHCYACPWAITVCPVGLAQNLVIFGTVPFFWLGAMIAYGLVAARGFCGWFCPFGTLNDLLSFRKTRIRPALSYGKFVILLGTLVASWALTDTVFCKLCPAASLEASLPYLFLGVAKVNGPFLIHMLTLGLSLVGMLIVARFWCRYLCPMGAVFALFNRVSLLQLDWRSAECTGCDACLAACPMGIDPRQEHDGHNCIKCGACTEQCVPGSLTLRYGRRTKP